MSPPEEETAMEEIAVSVQILFVCPDPYFAELFTNYAGNAQHEFSLLCFTDNEKALAFYQTKGDSLQALLAPQPFLNQLEQEDILRICLSDFTQRSENRAELQHLNIYQQRRDILADLQLLLGAHLGLNRQCMAHGHTHVLTFFSTQGGSGKSTLAYLTALRAAQEGKSAYISLESAPFTDVLYPPAQCAVRGEELLYAIRDRQDPVKAILPALTHNSHNVYVLPSCQSLQDLMELTAENWKFLLESLFNGGGMDYIILDLGSELNSVSRMAFDHSDLAVAVYTDDPMGRGKRDRLLQDPNFSQLRPACPCLEVRNKCRQKLPATDALIPVPFSKTIGSASSLSAVLGGNSDLFSACSQLLQAAGKER